MELSRVFLFVTWPKEIEQSIIRMATMATVAIGDIHGNLSALEDLLAKVVPTMSQRDVLVFLGDYIDRGSGTRGCVERIVRLKDEAPCPVVTLSATTRTGC